MNTSPNRTSSIEAFSAAALEEAKVNE